MEPIVGDEVLFLRHILSLKALQPLLAIVSYETDGEQSLAFKGEEAPTYGQCCNLRINLYCYETRTLFN